MSEVHPQSPIPEHVVGPLGQDPTFPKKSGSDSLLIEDSISPRDRGGIPQ